MGRAWLCTTTATIAGAAQARDASIHPQLRIPEEKIYLRYEDVIVITDKGYENFTDFGERPVVSRHANARYHYGNRRGCGRRAGGAGIARGGPQPGTRQSRSGLV